MVVETVEVVPMFVAADIPAVLVAVAPLPPRMAARVELEFGV